MIGRRSTLALIGLGATPSFAQSADTMRLVVPFPPGGTLDALTRLVAPGLQEQLGRPVIVENRPGAGTMLATQQVARAAPDGRTLLMIANSFLINGSLQPQVPYDAIRDFTGICQLAVVPHVVVVHPSTGITSFAEFIAKAKAEPGALSFGSYGNGTSNHLGVEQLKIVAGLDMVHVPYRGGSQAMTDLLAGRIQVMFANLPDMLPHIAAGSLRAIAIVAPQRSPRLPEVPTLEESGYAVIMSNSWFGMVAPAGVPPTTIDQIGAACREVLARPIIRARLEEQGFTIAASTPADFNAMLRRDFDRYAEIVRRAGIKPD